MALDARSTLKPASEANGGAIPLPTGKSSPGPGVRERLAVIIPVHNGGEELRRCLQAVMLSATRPDEVIVVDDASTDGSADIAQRAGAQVVRLSAPTRGPGFARNRGAEIAQGEVLFFVDADVLLHPDTLGLALETLRGDSTLDACFGSYDDAPAAQGSVSQYKNLMHHYVHQHAAENAATFWTGCGAIRKAALQQAGGFGEDHKKPSIETSNWESACAGKARGSVW